MYVDPHVGSVVDLLRWPRRCRKHRVAVRGISSRFAFVVSPVVGEALGQQHDLREPHPEDVRDPPHCAPCWIGPPRLDVGDPSRMDLGQVTEFLLAEVPFPPQPANR